MKRIFAIFVVAALACTLVFATACVTDANVTTEQLLEAMSASGDIQSISVTVSNGELNTADYRLIYSYYADGNGEPVIDGILKDDPIPSRALLPTPRTSSASTPRPRPSKPLSAATS